MSSTKHKARQAIRSGYYRQVRETLADAVRKGLQQSGRTQQELADHVGASRGWVGHVVTGRVMQPEPDKLAALADYLNLDRDEVFRLAGYAETPPLPSRNADITAALDRLTDVLRDGFATRDEVIALRVELVRIAADLEGIRHQVGGDCLVTRGKEQDHAEG